jgi:hypothetical protein
MQKDSEGTAALLLLLAIAWLYQCVRLCAAIRSAKGPFQELGPPRWRNRT